MVIGVLQEPGVDLHLAGQEGFISGEMSSRRVLPVALGEVTVRRMTPTFFCERTSPPASCPNLIELAPVLVGPFFRDVVWRMRRPGRKYMKKGLSA